MSLSSIVIKVKYGETLRRMSPHVHDKKLALDIFMLKEKIRNLFGFAPGAVFNMTYEDEDGDIVALATDDDIHDVMQQSLDPLRITVKLSYGNNPGAGGLSGTNSAPMRVPQNSFQPQPKNSFQQQNSYQQPPQNSFQQPPQNPFQQPPQDPLPQHQQQQQRYQLQQQLFQCEQQQRQLRAQLQALYPPLPQPQFQTMNAPFNHVDGGSTNSSGSTNSF